MPSPFVLVDQVDTPEGVLALRRRRDEWMVSIAGRVLMSSSLHRSEDAVAKLGVAPIAGRPRPKVLVGGLGLGFTLRATLDALFPCARDPLTFAEQITGEGLQAHLVPEAWLFASETPDIWIDIAETLPRKIQARLAHTSQHTDPAELERNWYRRAAAVGEPLGLSAAEAFKRIDLR